MSESERPGPTIFVLFGATGDLAKRMVLPAFYQLAQHDLLPEKWLLVGNGRGDVSHEDFAGHFHGALEEFGPKPDPKLWDEFAKHLRFAGGGFEKADPGSLLDVLDKAHEELSDPDHNAQYVHYLAIPPSAFAKVTEGLGEHDLAKGARVVYEKPFGTSPQDFRRLDALVHDTLQEEQVYRIDHFLGKEGAQDLHAVRFGNGVFASTWGREHIRAVQIDVPEKLDIADRAEFYESTGALLDMIVTHLFQLAAEVAMEPPASMAADDLQAAREQVIAAFRPLGTDDVVLGQFDGYRDTEGIPSDSTQNTFVAARLWIDNPRWEGVPFLLRTGKQLAEGAQRVSVIYRDPDGPLHGQLPSSGNVLSFDLAGSGGVCIGLNLKQPGPALHMTSATVGLALDGVDGADPLPPYVRLISDVLNGDRTLFTRPDGLSHAWDAITPLLENPPTAQPYARGSWGPQAAQELAAPDGWLVGGGKPDAS